MRHIFRASILEFLFSLLPKKKVYFLVLKQTPCLVSLFVRFEGRLNVKSLRWNKQTTFQVFRRLRCHSVALCCVLSHFGVPLTISIVPIVRRDYQRILRLIPGNTSSVI